ncbi:NAD(P)/FAD-dependent oxidoreductase [Haloterrigena alkaliphila]|uniref:NAD(P)/FAD-dependent oxidoreductase n=1 Tax=Haloterrigena alkaliphila TaxID=2816475 RepID=A0A8A2VAA8_9EURY|nr:NAD(P)/FAD-dependent oxidoreductase [Haloterrigena alkaliphila]QSW98006.1 NAD(P)/FAD-dependent oxidoreductase [Haloterrigena alkaliphila]
MTTETDDRDGPVDEFGTDDVDPQFDADVAVVGGGPAGCSAGVFTARAGLETTIFDRGSSSLRRCACLENYLGFPGGIDVETFLELAQDHATDAGCRLRRDLVESVVALEDAGFRLEPQDGDPITARFVIAATKYDGEYLRGLDSDDAVFVSETHDGEAVERFDRDYPDDDGRTPVDGLYVAGPLAGGGDQAIIAAGHGATIARALLEDLRRADGYWGRFAEHYDWRRLLENRDEEWADSERWVDLFAADAPDDREESEVRRLAEAYADERDAAYLDDETASTRAERGQRRLARALDDEILLEAVDEDAILERATTLERTGTPADDAGGVDD